MSIWSTIANKIQEIIKTIGLYKNKAKNAVSLAKKFSENFTCFKCRCQKMSLFLSLPVDSNGNHQAVAFQRYFISNICDKIQYFLRSIQSIHRAHLE